MTPLVVTELVLALVVIVVVGALTFVWARRRFISGDGRPVMLCARRANGGRWRLGLARLGSERFEWFSIVGPSLRPRCPGLGELDLGSATRSPTPSRGSPIRWPCRAARGAESCEFAFVPAAYTAVRAWLESSPPGYNVNVA